MALALRKTVSRAPRVPYERIAEGILGRQYDLSLVVCADALAARMNREYRDKSYNPNVLSFPLSKTEGEIFLNASKAAREARAEGVSLAERMTYLFIHACLHLKGLPHGKKMDAHEVVWMRRCGYPRFTLD